MSNNYAIIHYNKYFFENSGKQIKEGKSEKEANGNKNRHYFFIPKEARWSILSKTSENIGEKSSIVHTLSLSISLIKILVTFYAIDINIP
jgi:hypothetical protein